MSLTNMIDFLKYKKSENFHGNKNVHGNKDIQNVIKEPSLKVKARSLLLGFFVMMFGLTVISKAADSITIAQVTTQTPKGSMLTFEANGNGTVTADVKKYVKVQEGLGIDKINVKIGQEVKKGDVLLVLDKNDIQNALEAAKREVEKLANQMKQEQLSNTSLSLSTQEKAKVFYENAKLDLVDAKTALTDAKAAYENALVKKKEADHNYEQALKKDVTDIYKEKKDAYKEEQTNYKNVSITNEETLNTVTRNLEDSKDTLKTLESQDALIQNKFGQYLTYVSADGEKTKTALEELYEISYGDSDTYEKHKEEADALRVKITRATEDLDNAKLEYYESVNMQENVAAHKAAVTSAKRALQDAQEDLDTCIGKENKINTALSLYLTATLNDDKVKAVLNLNQAIYGISGYKKHLNEIDTIKEKISQYETDLSRVQKKNNNTLEAEQAKLDKIKAVLDSIDKGTYDSKENAQTEKQEALTAAQNVETQEQAIKTAKRGIVTAKRALKSAKLEYEQSKQQDSINEETAQKQEKAASLRIAALELDLEAKEEILEDLEVLKDKKGKVTSLVSGTVDTITLEAGKKTSADNSIIINTSGFGILVKVPKEEGEYVSVGDEMKLTAKGKKDKITVNVEGIRFTTDNQTVEWAEITASMPEGDYIPGATMTAKIQKKSDLYDMCIPLTAVRTDTTGEYCLVTQTKNTVLGEELLALRVPITILEKDNTLAAVETTLSQEDNVIISSNKNISEGNRVRLKQTN